MNAKQYIDELGENAIGQVVQTEAIGEYPGGLAEIIEIYPDPAAPDIVCMVLHPIWGEMWILEYEDIQPSMEKVLVDRIGEV